jgi:hypothetical protein
MPSIRTLTELSQFASSATQRNPVILLSEISVKHILFSKNNGPSVISDFNVDFRGLKDFKLFAEPWIPDRARFVASELNMLAHDSILFRDYGRPLRRVRRRNQL